MNFLRVRTPQASLNIRWIVPLILLVGWLGATAAAQEVALKIDPSTSTVNFTLGDVLHTVRGTFKVTRGNLRFERASGKVSGEIVVDAKSGESGSGMRDRKMHKEVLESDRYPEIAFHPDRVDGQVSLQGK